MRRIIVIILSIGLFSCFPEESEKKVRYEEETGLFVVRTYNENNQPMDTSWYYADSSYKKLVRITTTIYKGNNSFVNQIYNYNEGELDLRRSIQMIRHIIYLIPMES